MSVRHYSLSLENFRKYFPIYKARGYAVMLAEAGRDLGGRVTREAVLPGMSEYIRVRDYREQQLLNAAKINILRLHDVKHGAGYRGGDSAAPAAVLYQDRHHQLGLVQRRPAHEPGMVPQARVEVLELDVRRRARRPYR